MRLKSCLHACALALLAQCVSQEPVTLREPGAIRGVIVPPDYASICVEGTNLCVNGESVGAFCIYGVPPGEYRLSIVTSAQAVKVAVTVEEGDTVDLDSLNYGLPDAPPANPTCVFADPTVSLFNARDSAKIPGMGGSVVYTSAESVLVTVVDTGRIVFLYHGVVIADDSMGKPRPRAVVIHCTGNDTVMISRNPDAGCWRSVVILDSAQFWRSVNNQIAITTAPTKLTQVHGPATGGYEKVVVGADTFILQPERVEFVDWDVLLVDDSTGDSLAWWTNYRCWSTDACTPVLDFSGDVCNPDSAGLRCVNYTPDLHSGYLPDGTYSVYVHFYECASDCDTATPVLTAKLGRVIAFGAVTTPFFDQVIQHTPPRALRLGETWLAGRISMPERTFVPSDSTIAAGLLKAAKSR